MDDNRLQMGPTFDAYPFADIAWSESSKRNEWFPRLDEELKRDLRAWSHLWIVYFDPVEGFQPPEIEVPAALWFRGLAARVRQVLPEHIHLSADEEWPKGDRSDYC